MCTRTRWLDNYPGCFSSVASNRIRSITSRSIVKSNSVPPFQLPHQVELRGVSDRHDCHDTGLHRIADDEICGIGNAAGHIQRDDAQAMRPHFFNRPRDLAAHHRACQHQQLDAWQAHYSTHCRGQLLFADEGDCVDRDTLAADVVAVSLADGAHRHLSDLRASAHDDDALAVDLGRRWRFLDTLDAGYGLEAIDGRLRPFVGNRDLEVNSGCRAARMDVDVRDVGAVVCEDCRQSGHHARTIEGGDEDGVRAHVLPKL